MRPESNHRVSAARLALAWGTLDDAQAACRDGRYRMSMNRCYYAAYYAMYAVLALDGIERKHHSGVMSEFRRLYVKTGIFEDNISDTVKTLFKNRLTSDYSDFYTPTHEEAAEMLRSAETVVNAVKTYLQSLNL